MKYQFLTEAQRSALNVYVKLMRATNRATKDIHRHLQEDNLTHSQFAVLEALYHLGPLSLGELSQKILRSNANLTTVVGCLEKKELVGRDRSPHDRRLVTVSLTAAGEDLIARVFPRHAEAVVGQFAVLSDKEQSELASLLKKLGCGK